MKVLVASDEPVVRRGFREILASRAGWSVRSEVTDPDELAPAVARNGADVVLLVLPLGDRGGIDLVQQVRAQAPPLPVIVVAAYLIEHYAISFLRAGANAFLPRNAEPEEILAAIEAVAGGGKYISSSLATDMARNLGSAGVPEEPHERLSRRELEVFRMLASGHSPTGIATLLHLSVKTVSTYRARIFEKTGFRSNADIVGYAIRHRLI